MNAMAVSITELNAVSAATIKSSGLGLFFEHRYNGMSGENGQQLPVDRYFREGLIELQREFNVMMRKLVRRLDELYDMLAPSSKLTFSPRFRAGPFGAKRHGAMS